MVHLHLKKFLEGCWTKMQIEDCIEQILQGKSVEDAVGALLETTTSSDIAVVPMPLPCKKGSKDPACERDPIKAAQLMQPHKMKKVQ